MMKDIQLFVDEVFRMDPKYRGRKRVGSVKNTTVPRNQYRQLKTETGQALFLKTCAACHNVGGGPRIGPDLAGITERRTGDWLKRYISQPERLRRQKDPIALALRQKYRNVLMPYLGLSETDAADVLTYVQAKTREWRRSGKQSQSVIK